MSSTLSCGLVETGVPSSDAQWRNVVQQGSLVVACIGTMVPHSGEYISSALLLLAFFTVSVQ